MGVIMQLEYDTNGICVSICFPLSFTIEHIMKSTLLTAFEPVVTSRKAGIQMDFNVNIYTTVYSTVFQVENH